MDGPTPNSTINEPTISETPSENARKWEYLGNGSLSQQEQHLGHLFYMKIRLTKRESRGVNISAFEQNTVSVSALGA
jgi:hypothetical protein